MVTISNIILDVLDTNRRPIDYQFLLDEICKQKNKPNKTSIYRALDALEKQHKITRANISDSKSYWETNSQPNIIHVHIVCKNCGQIQCQPTSSQPHLLPNTNTFSTQKTEITITGLCNKCN
jgi:Fe2+ or Zn2+ uptake regulation protein